MSYDTLIQRLWELREEKRALAEREKAITDETRELQNELILAMQNDGNGVTSIKSTVARATLTETTVVNMTDPEAFFDYVKTNDADYLLRRQPASAACKEAIQALGMTIPGIRLITLPSIQLRTNR